MALIDFDKFLASFITEIKKNHMVITYNIPSCIKKALEDQGLEYKGGEIVKSQRRVSAEAKENGYDESEDEKIRKKLIHLVNKSNEYGGYALHKWEADEMLAWLEKQGENPICKVKIGEKYKCIASPRYSCFFIGDVYEVTDDFIAKLINLCSDCFVLLEEQGTSYTKRDVDDAYVEGMAFAKDELEKQKPTWSEEDDSMFQSCIGAVATNDYYKGEEKEQIYDWLKSLKQRIGGSYDR